MPTWIRNPETGRKIRKNGATYKKMMEEPKYAKYRKSLKAAKPVSPPKHRAVKHSGVYEGAITLPKAKPSSLSMTLSTLPVSRLARQRKLKRQMAKLKTERKAGRASLAGRGIRTRGWAAAAPQKGMERNALYNSCGNQCFLKPETLGFPICPALREGQGCKVDCRGLTAARVRAAEWKYPGVRQRATELEKMYKCGM
jgi:hypothetical protein